MSRKNALTQAQRRRKLADIRATDNQRKQLARRKAMGIALIQKPLKYIKHRNTIMYMVAKSYADAGSGAAVQYIARRLK